MLRRIFTKGLKFPLCPTDTVRQKMIMTIISKSFANHTQQRISSEKSPFMKYREIKKPESLVQQNKIEIKPTSEASDLSSLFKKAITESEKLMKNSDLLEKLDHSALETITDNFWRLYFAHKRLITNSRFFQGKMTFGAYLPKGYNLYLLNSAVANPEILKSMRNLFEKLTKVYELNEKDILSKHQTYIEAVRCFSKFEICHEYQNFWNIMYRFVEERIALPGTFTEKEINLLSTCLKVLSRHKYYLKNHEQLKTSLKIQEDLKQTEEIQKKLFDFFIINNQLEREASGWITLLIEFHLAEDDLFQPLGTFLTKKRFKNIDDASDLAWSLNKIVKFLHNKYFATLFMEMKQTVLKKAARNQLTIKEISLILRSFVVENPKFPEENLELLWTNLNHNIRDKKSEDFDLYNISSIMTNLTFSKHLTSERFWFLQECALLSFDQSKSKYLNPQVEHQKNEDIDEDAENLEDPNEFNLSDSKIRFVSECVKILGNLGQREAIKKINFDFLQKLLLTIRENLDNIIGSNLADLFISLAKLDQKCREKTAYKALKDKEMNFLKTRTHHILKKINIFKAKDVAKVFQSYCILNYMGEIEYKLLCDTISQKLHQLQPYYCMQILQGVADLKKNPKTSSFQTDPFEKAVVDRIILSLGTLSKEEFMVTIYPIQLLKELTYINELSQAVEDQLLKHIDTLTFKEISYKAYNLDSVKTLSHNFLAQLKPAIINKINEADRKALFYLISTYTKNNTSPPGLFESLERAVQKQIQNYMQKKLKNKDELKEFLMIFTSLAKFKFENAGLAKDFETLFEQNLAELSAQDLIFILNGMTIYSSSNLDFLKSLLAALNTEVTLQKESFYKLTPSQHISAFQQGMFSIELEYGDTINLKEYPDIYKLHKYLEENIESVRYKQPSVSIYQSHVFEDLKGMKYDIQEEYPVGVFVSDLIIKPKTILEIAGPVHYIHGTKTLILKSQRKLRQLQKLGYKVAVIPYFEWEEVEKTHYRAKYLQNKIEH